MTSAPKARRSGIITQSNYIPWKGYFDAIAQTDLFVIYDEMQFTKRDWRNRNLIKTEKGLKWLTIPVEVKGKFHQKINETVISDPKWGKKHWGAISQAYRKAQHYAEIKDLLEPLYLGESPKFLSEINLNFLRKICQYLSIDTEFHFSKDFDLKEDRNDRLINLCLELSVTDYYSGPAAKEYMEISKFEQNGIEVHFFNYLGYPEYQQLHGAFEHGVSIIDLLFNEGPNAKNLFQRA